MSIVQVVIVGALAFLSLLAAIIFDANFWYLAIPCSLISGGYAVVRWQNNRLMSATNAPAPSIPNAPTPSAPPVSSGGLGGIIWFFTSIVIFIVFVAAVTVGVAIHDAGNAAGRIVVLIACLASACYFAVVALLIVRRPDIWRRPLSWFGIKIVGSKWPKEWQPFSRHFFVLPTIPTLALLLTIWTSWTAYVLGLVGVLLILSMYFISLKESITSGFWKRYYDFLARRRIYIVAAFLIYVPFEASWVKLGRYGAAQFGAFADWASSPKPTPPAKAANASAKRPEPKAAPRFSKNLRPARPARKDAEETAGRAVRNAAPEAEENDRQTVHDSELGRIMANEKRAREGMEAEIRKLNR